MNTNTLYILSQQSKGLSTETIDPPNTSLSLLIDYVGNKIRVKFTGCCLRQSNKLTCIHRTILNIYIVYKLDASSSHVNDTTLKNCLFGAVTLTKNSDIDKYGYSCYGIGFDRRGSFSFPGGWFGQNILIFGVDMSFSAQIDNKEKRHTSLKNTSNTRITTYTNCRKKVLNQFYCDRKEILFKFAL